MVELRSVCPAAIVGRPTVGVSGAQLTDSFHAQASLWPPVTFFPLQHFVLSGSESFEMMSEVAPELRSHVAPPAAHVTALHPPASEPHPRRRLRLLSRLRRD